MKAFFKREFSWSLRTLQWKAGTGLEPSQSPQSSSSKRISCLPSVGAWQNGRGDHSSPAGVIVEPREGSCLGGRALIWCTASATRRHAEEWGASVSWLHKSLCSGSLAAAGELSPTNLPGEGEVCGGQETAVLLLQGCLALGSLAAVEDTQE